MKMDSIDLECIEFKGNVFNLSIEILDESIDEGEIDYDIFINKIWFGDTDGDLYITNDPFLKIKVKTFLVEEYNETFKRKIKEYYEEKREEGNYGNQKRIRWEQRKLKEVKRGTMESERE